MKHSQKFLFDTSFDTDRPAGKPRPEVAAPEPEPMLEPSFSQADLDAARAEGMAAGHAQGVKDALAEQERSVAATLAAIGSGLQDLLSQQNSAFTAQEKSALAAAMAIVGKLFPQLAASHGITEIEGLVAECLQRLREEPRVVIRVADSMLDSLREHLDKITQQNGFEGKVVLLADENLAIDSVRVEWADGGAERDSSRVWDAIEAIVGGTGGTKSQQQADKESDQDASWPSANNTAGSETIGLAQSA